MDTSIKCPNCGKMNDLKYRHSCFDCKISFEEIIKQLSEDKALEIKDNYAQSDNATQEHEVPQNKETLSATVLANYSESTIENKMKLYKGILGGFFIIFVFLVLGLLSTPHLFTPKWEYKIVAPNDTSFTSEMNTLGESGWELVSARRATSDYGGPKYEVILKRPKS